jgi:hypothetical protein
MRVADNVVKMIPPLKMTPPRSRAALNDWGGPSRLRKPRHDSWPLELTWPRAGADRYGAVVKLQDEADAANVPSPCGPGDAPAIIMKIEL